jgi:hypothetical protein
MGLLNDGAVPENGGAAESPTGELPGPVIQVPPTVGIDDPNPDVIPDLPEGGGDPGFPGGIGGEGDPVIDAAGTTVQDLYPEDPGVVGADPGDVPDPTGADVTETDPGVADVGTTEAETSTGRIEDILDVGGGGIDAEQTGLTTEAQVDAELARILEQGGPLMTRASAEAVMRANARGLQNTSMAVGMAQGAMVDRALPMAQQNAQQALQRELANTENRQEASMFTAEQQNRLTALEAELGMELNIFNADQLNEAERLGAQLRTALEQQDAAAYNDAAKQLADLQRDAQAQQAELDYRASQAEADARNALNAQIVDNITRINQQYLQNMGAADVATIQGTYQQLIQMNATAGTIFNGYLSAMGALMDDPDMTPSQVQDGLASMQTMLEASMRMLAGINDMDIEFEMEEGGTTNGPTCFEAGTCFRMADGTVKKIEDIKAKDEMALGGRVKFAVTGDGTQETWFDVDGIKVSGSHAMQKDGVWMRVRDAGYEQVETIDTFYTLINEDHRMVAESGQIFADYDEVDLQETGWEEYSIDKLNGKTDEQFRGELAA